MITIMFLCHCCICTFDRETTEVSLAIFWHDKTQQERNSLRKNRLTSSITLLCIVIERWQKNNGGHHHFWIERINTRNTFFYSLSLSLSLSLSQPPSHSFVSLFSLFFCKTQIFGSWLSASIWFDSFNFGIWRATAEQL